MFLLVITNPSVEYAAYISEMIWKMGRPEQTRTEQYVTQFYCGWVEHPDSGQLALNMPISNEYIHPDCDADSIANNLPILDEEKTSLISSINAAKGSRIQPSSLIPASLVGNILTVDEAITAGWYPDRVLDDDTLPIE